MPMCDVQREFYQTVRRTEFQRARPSRTQPLHGAAHANSHLSTEDTAARPPVNRVRAHAVEKYVHGTSLNIKPHKIRYNMIRIIKHNAYKNHLRLHKY